MIRSNRLVALADLLDEASVRLAVSNPIEMPPRLLSVWLS
jgi:hypothetical protein